MLVSICSVFEKNATTDEVILKIEKEINKELLTMNKKDEKSDQ